MNIFEHVQYQVFQIQVSLELKILAQTNSQLQSQTAFLELGLLQRWEVLFPFLPVSLSHPLLSQWELPENRSEPVGLKAGFINATASASVKVR